MKLRYETQRGADKVMILDRKNGDAVGYVHSAAVARQVVDELNKMDAPVTRPDRCGEAG